MKTKLLLFFCLFLDFTCLAQSLWDNHKKGFLSAYAPSLQVPINPAKTSEAVETLTFPNKISMQFNFFSGCFFPSKKRIGWNFSFGSGGGSFTKSTKLHKIATQKYTSTHFISEPYINENNSIINMSLGLTYRQQYKNRWLFLYETRIGIFGGDLAYYDVDLKQKNSHEILRIGYRPKEKDASFISFQAGFRAAYAFGKRLGFFMGASIMTYQSKYSYTIKETNLISEQKTERIFSKNHRQFDGILEIGLMCRY